MSTFNILHPCFTCWSKPHVDPCRSFLLFLASLRQVEPSGSHSHLSWCVCWTYDIRYIYAYAEIPPFNTLVCSSLTLTPIILWPTSIAQKEHYSMAALDSIMVMLNAMFTTYLLSPNKVCCYVNHAFWPLPSGVSIGLLFFFREIWFMDCLCAVPLRSCYNFTILYEYIFLTNVDAPAKLLWSFSFKRFWGKDILTKKPLGKFF